VTEARTLWKTLWGSRALQALFELCFRGFRWGVTDLRRLRLTAANGNLRVQVESVGLMFLFLARPDFAFRWLNHAEDQRKLFKETRPLLTPILKDKDLVVGYNVGSAVAQHPRFASASRGMRVDGATIEVFDQEFDPKDPFTFHLGLAHFLRLQKRILDLLPGVFPFLSEDASLQEVLQEYRQTEEKVWWVLERKYAEEVKALAIPE